MILYDGAKVLIVHRRLFEHDHSRYFIGIVNDYEEGIAKVTGSTWILDELTGRINRKSDERTKIFSIGSGTLIVYELPHELDLSKLKFQTDEYSRLWLRDGAQFEIDLSENERVVAAKRAS